MCQKLSRFNEYFQINEAIQVSLEPVNESSLPKDEEELTHIVPPLFKLANEVSVLEQTALRPLRQLGDVAEDLAQYLKLQSRKIDLILSHILAKEEVAHTTAMTESFGGSGFVLLSDDPFNVGQFLQCKLFLQSEAAAVFCFAEVIAVENESNETSKLTCLFSHITEQDQELIVRASLHAQSRILKKKQLNKKNN